MVEVSGHGHQGELKGDQSWSWWHEPLIPRHGRHRQVGPLSLRLGWPVPGQAKDTSEKGEAGGRQDGGTWEQEQASVYSMGPWSRKQMGWKPGGGGMVEMRTDTEDPCQVSQDPQQIREHSEARRERWGQWRVK